MPKSIAVKINNKTINVPPKLFFGWLQFLKLVETENNRVNFLDYENRKIKELLIGLLYHNDKKDKDIFSFQFQTVMRAQKTILKEMGTTHSSIPKSLLCQLYGPEKNKTISSMTEDVLKDFNYTPEPLSLEFGFWLGTSALVFFILVFIINFLALSPELIMSAFLFAPLITLMISGIITLISEISANKPDKLVVDVSALKEAFQSAKPELEVSQKNQLISKKRDNKTKNLLLKDDNFIELKRIRAQEYLLNNIEKPLQERALKSLLFEINQELKAEKILKDLGEKKAKRLLDDAKKNMIEDPQVQKHLDDIYTTKPLFTPSAKPADQALFDEFKQRKCVKERFKCLDERIDAYEKMIATLNEKIKCSQKKSHKSSNAFKKPLVAKRRNLGNDPNGLNPVSKKTI